jgi:hypothetical protein
LAADGVQVEVAEIGVRYPATGEQVRQGWYETRESRTLTTRRSP